jgi:CBS domain-containing protein
VSDPGGDVGPAGGRAVMKKVVAAVDGSPPAARAMTVETVMSRDPLTIRPDAPLREASDVMWSRGVHHLPVVGEGGRLIGIITDRDLMHAALLPALADQMPWDARRVKFPRVRDAMTWAVVTTRPDATLVEAGLVMVERHIGSLPVVDGGRLVGILTEHDVLVALRPGIGFDSEAPAGETPLASDDPETDRRAPEAEECWRDRT